MSGPEEDKKIQGTITTCPECKSALQKCLIQQNYAMVICPSLTCGYPFNQAPVLDNLVYIDDKDVLDVAQRRLTKD